MKLAELFLTEAIEGKWAVKGLESDMDPIKASYNKLFADAFKTFPAPLQQWFHSRHFQVGGNGIFDINVSWDDWGSQFEENFGDEADFDPEGLHADLLQLGDAANRIYKALESMKPAYDKFEEFIAKTQPLEKIQREYKKMKGLQVALPHSTLEFLSSDGRGTHDPFPLYIYRNGKCDKYQQPPEKLPSKFDPDWMFAFVWNAIIADYGVFEILTGKVLTKKTKIKVIDQPAQPSDQDLKNWYSVQE